MRAVEWFYLAVGLTLTWRHFFLFDDSFIYFRYVDNLVLARVGLVYNGGEYVEGFSSPLWTLLLVVLRATGLDWVAIVRLTSLLGLVGFWWMGVRLNRQLCPGGATLNFPLAWLCGLYCVTTWFSSGSETVLLQLLAPAYALYVMNPSSLLLQSLVALSPLVRHELLLPVAVVASWAWLAGRRPPVRLLLLSAAFLGSWELFRIVYYADLLPNTFYLKNVWDPARGLVYLGDTFLSYGLPVAAGAFCALALALAARGERLQAGPRLAMLLAALPVVAYTAAVGGTPTHYRFLAFPTCLALFACAGLAERALRWWRIPRLGWAFGIPLSLCAASLTPPHLEIRNFEVDGIQDAAYYRRVFGSSGHFERGIPALIERARSPGGEFRYRGVIRVSWCVTGYEKLDRRVVHRYGLTDAIVARAGLPQWKPGHPRRGAKRLAMDLVLVQRAAMADGREIGPGLFRYAIRKNRARLWMVASQATLGRIERKIYNRHRPIENLLLAIRSPGELHFGGRITGRKTRPPGPARAQ